MRAAALGGEVAGAVALRPASAAARSTVGPWLLTGSAREGEAHWVALDETAGGARVGIGVLLRRDGSRPRADMGYAAAETAPARALLGDALDLVVRHALGPLGLQLVQTRTRDGDADLARTLAAVGFTYVGLDRRFRRVWSLAA